MRFVIMLTTEGLTPRRLLCASVLAFCSACSRTSLDDGLLCFESSCPNDSEQDANVGGTVQSGNDASTTPQCSSNECVDSSSSLDAKSDSSSIDVAAAALCLTGGNVFHFEGEPGNSIFEGSITIGPHDGLWSSQQSGPINLVSVEAKTLSDIATVVPWVFAFYAPFAREPLSVGVYDPVVGPIPTQATYPFLVLEANGRFCMQSSAARVDILAMKVKVTDLTLFTATFEDRCDGTTPALRGCVHFER